MGGGSTKSSATPKAYVTADAPEPEETAEDFETSGDTADVTDAGKKKRGTAALKINLDVGGTTGAGANVPV